MPAKTFDDVDDMDFEGQDPNGLINYNDAISYWLSVPASVNGVLGGFGEQTPVPKADIIGSGTFLRKLKTRMECPPDMEKLTIDMGAGIGRITRDLLWKVSDKCDLLEPVQPFVAQMENELVDVAQKGKLGDIYPIGMQEWLCDPSKLGKYWLVWCQWCVGQLPDDELVKLWVRCKEALMPNGTLVVKENIAPVEDVFDSTDLSVTRTDAKFRELFQLAGYKLIASEVQKGMPKELYPVRMYCLKAL
ncbi:CIC11C00000001678 [Sungouiella intermedia]|uniref:Alpha N-terminal protein methyltransferase 1 n=1 Tax=Sungouiella intermedia TaxID=45354 RepID=A0A1L0BCR3_9ASCO|nr:CIC11C00000001678 [[Candida] intermedia]